MTGTCSCNESVVSAQMEAGAAVDVTVGGLRDPGHLLLTGPWTLTTPAVVTGIIRRHTEHGTRNDIRYTKLI